MADMEHAQYIAELTEKYIDLRIEEAISEAVVAKDEEISGILQEIARLESSLSEERGKVLERDTTIQEFTAEIELLRERISELEAETPLPTAPPLFGACPLTGGMSASALTNVTRRWGDGIAVRLFSASGWTEAPDAGTPGRLLLSWKPSLSIPLVESQVLTALSSVPPGSKVCVWHEPDVKSRKGESVEPMKARAKEFYNIVKSKRPDLDVMAVLSGWTFDPSTNYDPRTYFNPEDCDVLGLDLDGIDGPKDFLPVIAKAQAWMKSNGIGRWTIAEYALRTTQNYTAADRAAWLREEPNKIKSLSWPPEEIVLFESSSYATTTLNTAAEREAWLSHIEA